MGHNFDAQAQHIVQRYLDSDPDGSRTASVIRRTFDQIYDGRNTGRYRLDQLSKTEKTHIGSLIEINLRGEFSDLFQDGRKLDFQVDGIDIDCKFSITFGGWMIPREAVNELLLVCTANDEKSEWGIGVIRAAESRLNLGQNQDAKRSLRSASKSDVDWMFFGEPLPENILLHLDREVVDQILNPTISGQKRVNELLRRVTNRAIPRGTIATVAQQDDYMKRVRAHGGATTQLAKEGYLVIGGTYETHREIARQLGATVPGRGETVSVRVVPADPYGLGSVMIEGNKWRLALQDEETTLPAPTLPPIKKTKD